MRVRAASGKFRLPAGRGFGKWDLMARRGRAKEEEANSRSLWKSWRPPPSCGVAEGVIGGIKRMWEHSGMWNHFHIAGNRGFSYG